MGKDATTTSNSSVSPNPQAAALYSQILQQAQGVANTPYQSYTGELVAPINAQQTQGIANLNAGAGFAAPYISQAAGLASGAANPITQQQIANYQNPYTQAVVNATQAQFNDQNAQNAAKLKGNSISQGSLGGNRNAVGQAVLQGQEDLAQAPAIANLESQGYWNAANMAQQQYQQIPLTVANQLASYGIQGQNAALTGANAQVGAGTLEQQTQQAQDQAALGQFQTQQAYPFQTTQWLAGLGTGVGSQLGTSTYGQTTGPAPNPFSQIAGLGIAALGAFGGSAGGAVKARAPGGGVSGTPWANAPYSYVPQVQGLAARALQSSQAPQAYKDQTGQQISDLSKQISGLGSKLNQGYGITVPGTSATSDALNDYFQDQAMGLGTSLSDYPALSGGFASGGLVRGYADGGGPSFDDLWNDRILNGALDEAGGLAAPGIPIPQPRPDIPDDSGSVNPGDPIRLDPEAYGRWERGVNTDLQLGQTAQTPADAKLRGLAGLPTAAPTSAPGLPPEVVAGASHPAAEEEAPEPASGLGYAAPPQVQPDLSRYLQKARDMDAQSHEGGLFGLGHLSPNAKMGLLAAGLGMLASRSPYFGVGVGEGGLAGLGAYTQAQQADIKQENEQQRIEMEAQRLAQEAQREAQEFGLRSVNSPILPNGQVNPAWKAVEDYKDKDKLKIANVQTENGVQPIVINATTHEAWDLAGNKISAEKLAAMTGTAPAEPEVPGGPVDYTKGAPRIEKGDVVPEPKPLPGYSAQAIKDDAAYYVATGNLPKASISPKNPMGMQSVQYQRLVRNYGAALAASKGMSDEDFADLRRFGPQAARFPLSRQGDQTVAIGTAIRHIGALEEYARAWDAAKGNINAPILRQAAAKYASIMGKPEPANLEQAASIAGPEIIKAIGVAGGGTGGEREAQEHFFKPMRATAEILGAANVAKTFLAGQLPAKEAQASAVHFPHEKFMAMVGPQEYDYLSAINHGKTPEGAKSGAASPVAPTGPQRPPNVPAGSQYSPSRNQWRTPDGTIYNADGSKG